MKTEKRDWQIIFKGLFGVAIAFALLMGCVIAFAVSEPSDVTGYALLVVFFGLALALFGCYLIVAANDPITLTNKISVMVLWVMGCLMSAFFLTFVFTDPPPEREYILGTICGLPSLFMAIMGIVLYRHELQQMDKHPFDDPLTQIDALKDDEPSLVPIRMSLLLGALLLAILIFDIWVAVTYPFPR